MIRETQDGGPRRKLLSIRLLGPPEVRFEEEPPLRFRIKKALALLCYLAAERRRHPRRELAELLWPESEGRRARAALRAVLYKLRKALGEDTSHDEEEGRFLVIERDRLGLEPRGIELDLGAFEAAFSVARFRSSPGGRSAAAVGRRELIGDLEEALGAYRGEFMEGFSLENAPSSSCGLRLSVRGGALFSGSFARGYRGSKRKRG